MFDIRAEFTISAFIEALLPTFSPKGKAVYVRIKCGLNVYPEEGEDDGESWTIHMLFERPSNYTKVWVSLENTWPLPAPETFEIRSDHDSCWRTDGFTDLFEQYLKHRDALEARKPGQRQSPFHCVDKVCFAGVEYEPIDQRDRYKKRLTKIEAVVP